MICAIDSTIPVRALQQACSYGFTVTPITTHVMHDLDATAIISFFGATCPDDATRVGFSL